MTNLITFQNTEYSVHLGEDCLFSLKDKISEAWSKVFVLVDKNTHDYCLPVFLRKSGILAENINLIEVTSGEQFKTLGTAKYIWKTLTDEGADRHSVFINLGGGVITDMGGYTAACFKRGINYINIPTSLMAMLDAAIGGKTGVNLDHLKNQIGLFRYPLEIFIDADFLNTLPKEHLISGYAEALKYGLIYDKSLWDKISKIKVDDFVDWYELIIPSVKIKMEVVEKDPHEMHLRKILNFGHTIGHAIETLSYKKNKPVLHGQAVAIGLVVESIISSEVVGLDEKIINDIFEIVNENYPLPELLEGDIPELMSIMLHDKKNVDGNTNFTLIQDIGESMIDQFCDSGIIEESFIKFLNMY